MKDKFDALDALLMFLEVPINKLNTELLAIVSPIFTLFLYVLFSRLIT